MDDMRLLHNPYVFANTAGWLGLATGGALLGAPLLSSGTLVYSGTGLQLLVRR